MLEGTGFSCHERKVDAWGRLKARSRTDDCDCQRLAVVNLLGNADTLVIPPTFLFVDSVLFLILPVIFQVFALPRIYCRVQVFHVFSSIIIQLFAGFNLPTAKAGGYAIQEQGAGIVARIEGSFTNVMGLPTERLGATLEKLSVIGRD